jgi:hypothetical protein
MWYVWIRREMHTGSWWRNLRERDNLEDLEVSGKIILKWILKYVRMPWAGSMLPRTGKNGSLFERQY